MKGSLLVVKFQLHDGPYVSLLQPIICQKLILFRRPWGFLWHSEEVTSNIKVAGKWQRQYLKPASRPNNPQIDECFRWSCTSWSRPTCSSVWRSSVTTSLFPLLPGSLMVRSKHSSLPKFQKKILCVCCLQITIQLTAFSSLIVSLSDLSISLSFGAFSWCGRRNFYGGR